MLNKNQSNKRNSWKYTLVLPLLVAFMFLFQIKVIAQKKEPEIINNNILKNNSNSEDSKVTSSLSADKEIFINGLEVSQNDLDKLDPNDIETMNVDKNSAKSTIKIITKKGSNIPGDTEIFINGEKVSKEEMGKIDNSMIETVNVSKTGTTKKTIKIITRKTEINNSSDVLEQAKIDAHQAKKDTEQARKDAQQAKIDAEQAREDALQAKKDAQQAKIEAEKSKKGK